MEYQKRINFLFDKYLQGTCSREEWEELLELISNISDEDAESLSHPLLQLWEQMKDAQPALTLDKEKIFHQIQQAIGSEENAIVLKHNRMGKLRWKSWIAAAAVLALLFLSAYFWKLNKPESKPTLAVEGLNADQVKPGYSKALLLLGNGQQVMLDSMSAGKVAQQGSTTILNSNGQLVYKMEEKNYAEPEQISENKVITGRANQYQVVLPDGTKVWLNAVSSITFPSAFSGAQRLVSITGEAYFEVAPMRLSNGKKMPFIVQFSAGNDRKRQGSVEVLGTHFNINAYADEDTVRTTLLEGSVKLLTATNDMGLLKPGQEATLAKGSLNIGPGDIEQAVAWKNGYFQFNKASLPVIMRQIGRWYDLDIRFEGPIPDRVFRGKLQRDLPLGRILNLLRKGDIRFRLEENVLIVTG